MAIKQNGKDWSDVAVAMDRCLRLFSDFAKPILIAHAADNLSVSNLLFLISIGHGEARVSDLVRRGRYVGSNASYALKALQEGGFIDRHQDNDDRRNAVVVLTSKGAAIVSSIEVACSDPKGRSFAAIEALKAFQDHCSKLPET